MKQAVPNAKVAAEYWVPTKGGKLHPQYAGVLDAAFKEGLKAISVEMLQFPLPENGMLAVARATATFEDGRIFTEIGDAGPGNVTPHIAPHICRMACTRAKGRALRDALNLGVALAEELMDDSPPGSPANGHQARTRAALTEREQPLPLAPVPPVMECGECHKALTKGQYDLSMKNYERALCPAHQPKAAQRQGY